MAYSSWSVVFNEQPSASKWNILGTNDAFFDSKVGSGTAWTSWTPTFTNLTIGNATVTGAYVQLGKTVLARLRVVFGTTSAMSTNPFLTLPVNNATAYDTTYHNLIGEAWYATDGNFAGKLAINNVSGSNKAQLIYEDSSSTFVTLSGLSSVIPRNAGTWTTGNSFTLFLNYETT